MTRTHQVAELTRQLKVQHLSPDAIGAIEITTQFDDDDGEFFDIQVTCLHAGCVSGGTLSAQLHARMRTAGIAGFPHVNTSISHHAPAHATARIPDIEAPVTAPA